MSIRLLCLSLSILLAAATPSLAGDRPQPALLEEETLRSYLPDAEEAQVEVRLDVDFTGDGLRDSAFVLRGNERRILKVMIGYATEVDVDYDPAGEMAMDPAPLGSASLSAKKGVLVVEDLAGGTSAIQSLHRFRYDPKQRRMRLIGEDVDQHQSPDRRAGHDGLEDRRGRLRRSAAEAQPGADDADLDGGHARSRGYAGARRLTSRR
jgi:hypothetical protein